MIGLRREFFRELERHLNDYVNTAIYKSSLKPIIKMEALRLRPAYISSQIKIADGMGIASVEDYLRKHTEIDILFMWMCQKEILSCETKKEFDELRRRKFEELWDIFLTDEEEKAREFFQENVRNQFLKTILQHLKSLKNGGKNE